MSGDSNKWWGPSHRGQGTYYSGPGTELTARSRAALGLSSPDPKARSLVTGSMGKGKVPPQLPGLRPPLIPSGAVGKIVLPRAVEKPDRHPTGAKGLRPAAPALVLRVENAQPVRTRQVTSRTTPRANVGGQVVRGITTRPSTVQTAGPRTM